jgi:hypothetical protein
MTRVCAGFVTLTLAAGCGGPDLMDPRSLAVVVATSAETPAQESYIETVLATLEENACEAVDLLRTREVALDAAAETQMLRAFSVARGLCAAGIPGFPVTQDALGQLSFLGADTRPSVGTLGVFAADDFRQTQAPLRVGEETCDGAWVSAPMLVTSSADRALRLAVPSGLRLTVSATPGFPGCDSGAGSVVWTSVRAGQVLTVHAIGDAGVGATANLELADAATRGELLHYVGNSLYQSIVSSGNDIPVSDLAGAQCPGFIGGEPVMVVDFGPTPRAVEISLSTVEASVVFALREDGSAHCSTDASNSYGASVSLNDVRGVLQIWTGSIQAGVEYFGDVSVYAW